MQISVQSAAAGMMRMYEAHASIVLGFRPTIKWYQSEGAGKHALCVRGGMRHGVRLSCIYRPAVPCCALTKNGSQ